MQNKAGLSLKI